MSVPLTVTVSMASPVNDDSPVPPPIGLYRYCPPGPDPFKEHREKVRQIGRTGAPCPANMHGCNYFSASEWRFCQMCEWEIGQALGVHEGTVAPMGGPIEEHKADVAAGRVVFITRVGFDDLVSELRRAKHTGLLQDGWIELLKLDPKAEHLILTRRQLQQLLQVWHVPRLPLTDEFWADLQAKWPPH